MKPPLWKRVSMAVALILWGTVLAGGPSPVRMVTPGTSYGTIAFFLVGLVFGGLLALLLPYVLGPSKEEEERWWGR
jgi:hypothetical protein